MLADVLPEDVVWLISAHAAATHIQAWMRGRWARAATRLEQRTREALVLRFIESHALGCVPLPFN